MKFGLIILISVFICGCECRPNIIVEKIYSLERDSEIHGRFFIGTGSIGESQYYYFYKQKDGGYILDSSPASKTVIYEINDTPRFEYFTTDVYCLAGDREIQSGSKWNLKLYVPKNTIIRKFKI